MRTDLNKQLCEHERYASSDSYSMVRHSRRFNSAHGADPELMASRESMVKRGKTKSFGENLNPLFGAVRKAVGKPWNKFYSELSKTFDKRSVINQHIIQHLFQYVKKDGIYVEDGELYVREWTFTQKLRDSDVEFFVDPRDGILKRNKHFKKYTTRWRERREAEAAEKAKLFKVLDKNNMLYFDAEKKIWYHYTIDYAQAAEALIKPGTFDKTYKVRHGDHVVEKTWEELSGAEKKHYGEEVYNPSQMVYDVHLDKKLVFNGSLMLDSYVQPQRAVSRYSIVKHEFNLPVNAYCKTKQTASHKLLKKAGIIT